MQLKEFIDKYKGKKIDFDGYYNGQCVDLFRQYCQEVLNIPQAYPPISDPAKGRGAVDFYLGFEATPQLKDNFTQIKNTADFMPIEGDVMIWNRKAGGGHGHISVCTGKNTDLSKFESFDQNWSKVSYCELVSHIYTNCLGVLRPKNYSSNTETIQVPKSDFESLVDKSSKYDEFVNNGYPNVKSVETMLNASKEDSKDIKKEYDEFVLKIVEKLNPIGENAGITDKNYALQLVDNLVQENDNLQKSLKDAETKYNVEVTKFKAENEELKGQLERLKKEIEDLKAKQIIELDKVLKRVTNVENTANKLEEKKKQISNTKNILTSIFNLFKR